MDFAPKNTVENIPKNSLEKKTSTEKAEDIYNSEILPIIEILKPEDVSLEEYEAYLKSELFNDVKKLQMNRNEIVIDPEQSMNEIKVLLNSRIKSVLEDYRNLDGGREIDPALVQKAKLIFLVEGNDFDISGNKRLEYGKWDGGIDTVDIRDLKQYIMGRENDFQLGKFEIDILMKTKYRKNMVTSSDYSYFAENGACSSLPKSLLIGLLESHSRDRNTYVIREGIKKAENASYDHETLNHLIATGYSKTCFQNIDKFQGDALKTLLVSGSLDDEDVLNYIVDSNIDKNEKAEYLDLLVKNNNIYFLKNKHRIENFNFKDVDFPYVDVARQVQHLDHDKLPLENVKAEIEKIIQDGNVSFLLSDYETKGYIKDYSEKDYESFRDIILQNNQEHLVIKFLKQEDQHIYAQKLISNKQESKLVMYISDFDEKSLDYTIFSTLKEKGFKAHLDNDFSKFKELPEKEALETIAEEGIAIFLDNFESFIVSQSFLTDPKNIDLSFTEFKNRINAFNPEGAREILETINLPPEELEIVLLDKIKKEAFFEKRINNTFNIIREFPHIKDQLMTEDVKNPVFEYLCAAIEKDDFHTVVGIFENFPLDESKINNEEFVISINKLIKNNFVQIREHGKNDFFLQLEQKIKRIGYISEYIPVQEDLLNKELFVEIEQYENSLNFKLNKDYAKYVLAADNPQEAWRLIPILEKEALETSKYKPNKEIILLYVSQFLERGNNEEKKHFFEKIEYDISLVSKNEKVKFYENTDYYKYILKKVYSQRNYNTYNHIEDYEDRSKDLDKYIFNKAGYEISLSGILGYKVKDSQVLDESILKEFSTRIDSIKEISNQEELQKFLSVNVGESKTHTLEGKILEYFNQNGYTMDTMNVLLAYQLMGTYGDFVVGSVDRVSFEKDKISKDFVLLDELVNQYGDNMKETIKSIQKTVATNEDAEIFAIDYLSKHKEKYDQLAINTSNDLKKIPKERISDQIIQKKILKSIKNTFQGIEDVQNKAEYFASLFSIQDLDNLAGVFNRHINELFVVDEEMTIDTAKVEALQSKAFNQLQSEISKYEEIKEIDTKRGDVKSQKQRVVKGYFSKNKENAHARMVGDICLASDSNMLKNENYFEFVLFDESRNKCMGTIMLLEMNEAKGNKKYLLYCPNPSVGLVSEVSAKKLYKKLTSQISQFAEENSFDAVLVDKRHGQATNRGGLFQQSLEESCIKNSKGDEIIYSLDEKHTLSGLYTYKDGLQTIWQK